MSDLTFLERNKLEKLFQMGGGYVLGFTNRTFEEFVADSVGRNIYDPKYDQASGSKAHRLRAFWTQEPNHVAGKLVTDLLVYLVETFAEPGDAGLIEECKRIAARLLEGRPVDAIEAIAPEGSERSFEILSRAVRDSIERNEPDAGLDRLHTFVTKLVRKFASARGIAVDKDKPLHSIFGEYVKALRSAGLIETDMTERILKSSISTMEAFSYVRNNQSLAHDNPTLSYDESLFIFNHVCSAVRFIRALEQRERVIAAPTEPAYNDDVPF